MTYDDFVARLQVLLSDDPSTNVDWATLVPAAIEVAELRCYRELDPMVARKSGTVATVAGQSTVILPSDCNIPRDLSYAAPPAGAGTSHIARRDPTFLTEMYAGGPSGTPKYWGLLDQASVLLAPTPSAVLAMTLTYTYRPPALTASNSSTWLSQWCPDLMVFAAMVFASGYQRNYGAQADDPQQAVSWETEYKRALTEALREEARRKGEGYFDKSMAAPPSSVRPTGRDANT